MEGTPTGLLGQNVPSPVVEGFRKGPGPVPTHPQWERDVIAEAWDQLKKSRTVIQISAVSTDLSIPRAGEVYLLLRQAIIVSQILSLFICELKGSSTILTNIT